MSMDESNADDLMVTDIDAEEHVVKHNVNPVSTDLGDEDGDEEDSHLMNRQKELVALQRLDTKSTQLQQEGKYPQALETMEKALVLRQHFFGADSNEVWQACRTVGDMCNLLAMTYLQQDEFGVAYELLQKAQVLTERHPPARAVTLNNLACLHRRQGQLHKALTYLNSALAIETKLDQAYNKADTHLNLCAVLSQLGKHQNALSHAQSALICLHEELQPFRGNNTIGHDKTDLDSSKRDRIAVLGIAYHNVGVEQEFLKLYDRSISSYETGLDFTSKYLGDTHGIVVTLQNAVITAKQRIGSKSRTDGSTGDGVTIAMPKRKSQATKLSQLKLSLQKQLRSKYGKRRCRVGIEG